MRTLLWLLALSAIAVGLALVAGVNTGYALLVVPPYRVQLSLNLLLAGTAIAFLLVYMLLRLISRTLALPGAVGQFRLRRRRDKASRALRDAITLYLEGRYSQALKVAGRAVAAGDGRGLAALFAARSAHALRDDTRYRIWLGRAAEFDEEIRPARLMTEAELAVDGRRFEEAEERLALLGQSGHRQIAALRLGLRTAQAQGHWEETVHLARQLVKHKALSQEQAAPLLRQAHRERLRELSGDADALAAYWKGLPAEEQADQRLVEKAVPWLVQVGLGSLARETLERMLAKSWDSELARLYGYCGDADPVAALARAEGWLKDHPRDGGLLFAVGRLCLAAQLWGKAQSYLEVSLGISPSVETHLALASLAERLERSDEAQAHYRRAAQLAAGA